MATVPDQPGSWLHEAFLARAADPGNEEGRHALGAFLTLRLADRFDPADAPQPLALAYQVRATRDYLADLEPQNVEANHLLQVVRMADAVQQGGTRAILWPPLLAYANWLEQELRLGEALDAVETALRLDDGTAPTEGIAALLQRARIMRLLGRLDEAGESYESARVRAVARDDTHSELLGRIGQAIVMRQKGNLSGSEKALAKILQDGQALGDQDAQARAHHDLGAAYNTMGRGREAIRHLYLAFELYERKDDRLRALSDVGEALKRLGAYEAAKDAFSLALAQDRNSQQRAAAMTALVELSGLMGDRVSFEKWHRELRGIEDQLPAIVRVDLQLALGTGYREFGQISKARKHVQRGLHLAEESQLNELVFAAERALQGLQDLPEGARPTLAAPPGEYGKEVSDVAGKLHALRSA